MVVMCPRPLSCSDTYGELIIAGESLHTGAWCALDLSELYNSPDIRHENVLIETQIGRSARSGVTDETEYSIPMKFSGAVDHNGTPWANPRGGLHANRRVFNELFVEPIRNGTSTLTAALMVPDEDDPESVITFEFDVQPLRLHGWTLLPEGYARSVLRLRVPVPEFVETS